MGAKNTWYQTKCETWNIFYSFWSQPSTRASHNNTPFVWRRVKKSLNVFLVSLSPQWGYWNSFANKFHYYMFQTNKTSSWTIAKWRCCTTCQVLPTHLLLVSVLLQLVKEALCHCLFLQHDDAWLLLRFHLRIDKKVDNTCIHTNLLDTEVNLLAGKQTVMRTSYSKEM